MNRTLCAVAVSGFFLFACRPFAPPNVPEKHILMFNGQGRLVDPTGDCGGRRCDGVKLRSKDFAALTDEKAQTYLEEVVKGLKNAPVGSDGRRQVLIFIHGGLNTNPGTVVRAVDKTPLIKGYYPIFLNWASSLPASYADYLLHVRNGQYRTFNDPTALFRLLGDFVRGLSRSGDYAIDELINRSMSAPRYVARGEGESCYEMRYVVQDEQQVKTFQKAVEQLRSNPNVALGCDCATDDDLRHNRMKQFAFLGKFITTPIVETGGTGSWDMMYRHARMLVRPETSIKGYSLRYPVYSSALGKFFAGLQDAVEKDGGPERWNIVIVGHSMGSIVANELIRAYAEYLGPNGEPRWLPIRNIVYMAAACTVRDYVETIHPYLRRHPKVKMYHLTLHPQAEVRESRGFGFLPSGSLLVWIDQFFGNPISTYDRTAGQFLNIGPIIAFDTPDDLKPRVFLKVFRAGSALKETDPQTHGDFNDKPFWSPDFWRPEAHQTGCSVGAR